MFTRPDITTYMELANIAASRSHAVRLKVGAVIVTPNRVMAFGYNGTPAGWDNCCETPENTTKPETIHGETNAIFKFVQSGISTKGCSLFLTHSPCLDCAKIIYLSQIEQVVYGERYRSDAGIEFLERCGIRVTQYA